MMRKQLWTLKRLSERFYQTDNDAPWARNVRAASHEA
jgi:hypothetical protein